MSAKDKANKLKDSYVGGISKARRKEGKRPAPGGPGGGGGIDRPGDGARRRSFKKRMTRGR